MSNFDIKKFVALIVFDDTLRNAYYDIVESQGINSSWDVYHVLADEETIPDEEIKIMERVYNDAIKDNKEVEKIYESAVEDFRENVRNKIERSKKGS